jgi:hypothetical protein
MVGDERPKAKEAAVSAESIFFLFLRAISAQLSLIERILRDIPEYDVRIHG